MPTAGDRLAAVVDIDVVPAGELALHRLMDRSVGVLDPTQSLIGEDHTEAERVVGGVSLPDGDLVIRAELLGQRREIEPPRPTADDRDPHGTAPPPVVRAR